MTDYFFQVLQQPARARACGSGAKSSADRRPVDPPPVVELKIYDAATDADVTFAHNANFFLYTTLESARPIAPMRGTHVPAPFPVLTGTPVAGMAYLDRPVPAGYFIFPDLSVRHEGKYRLSFNLFEELKEDKDTDLHPTVRSSGHSNNKMLMSSPMAPHAHVHFRLEVKSEPFVVYSAKKFPGLAESTQLSRVVAEQGCRVRIRRDVRMRRREPNNAKKDFDEYEDQEQQPPPQYRPEGFHTPDSFNHNVAADRARSVSASSVDGSLHQYPAIDRRSTQDSAFYNQGQYQAQPPQLAAPIPQQTVNMNSHLAFGSASQYQAPAIPNTVSQQPSLMQYNQQQPQLSNGHSRHPSNASNFDYTSSNPTMQQQAQYTTQPSYQDSLSQRHTPMQHMSHQVREPNNYPAIDVNFMNPKPPYFPQSNGLDHRSNTPSNPQQVLPPIKALQPAIDKTSTTNSMPLSSPTASYDPSGAGTYGFPSQITTGRATAGTKRMYDRSFDATHLNNSVVNGARPEAIGQDTLQIDTEDNGVMDEYEVQQLQSLLIYRRADGTKQHRKVPSPIL